MTASISSKTSDMAYKWCSISVYAHHQKRERGEKIINVRLPKQKNRQSAADVVLFTATLHPQIERKIGPKICTKDENVRKKRESVVYPPLSRDKNKARCFVREAREDVSYVIHQEQNTTIRIFLSITQD
ncbi:UNVERIFIED_CONTAM: hypothetical protein NCL1_16697 [Trichonephila clavipes]